MNDKKHILVADNSGESLANLGFLLQLSGFAVTSFSDEIEAINWLLQQDSDDSPPHMLLIHQPQHRHALFGLLVQLRKKFQELEILIVNPEVLRLNASIAELDPPLHQCLINEVYHQVKTILSNKNRSSPQRAYQDYRDYPFGLSTGSNRFYRSKNAH